MEFYQQIPPAVSSTMFRAVVFNNKGVRRMQRGCFDDAVILFTRVLETLNPIIPNARAQHRFLSSTMPSMLSMSTDACFFRQQAQHGGGDYDQLIEENHLNLRTNGDSRRVPDAESHNHDTNKSYQSTFQFPAQPLLSKRISPETKTVLALLFFKIRLRFRLILSRPRKSLP